MKLDPAERENNKAKVSNEDEPEAFEEFQPDFDIPAIVSWITHTGQKMYEILRENRTEYWNQENISCDRKHFDQPTERWSFWQDRLNGVAKDAPDDFVRNSAELAIKYMQDIKYASEKTSSQ